MNKERNCRDISINVFPESTKRRINKKKNKKRRINKNKNQQKEESTKRLL